jgi:hypothetical protein
MEIHSPRSGKASTLDCRPRQAGNNFWQPVFQSEYPGIFRPSQVGDEAPGKECSVDQVGQIADNGMPPTDKSMY